MNHTLCILYVLLALPLCRTENVEPNEDAPEDITEYLEENIADIESTATLAARVVREGILPLEETEKYYDKIVDTLEDITDTIKIPSHAYAFVNAKGIERVVMPNIAVKYPKLRVSLLMLLKILFELMPTTTDAILPVHAVDKLVDIFDTDDNLGIKAHVLDILSVWLLDNPRVQVRIVKMRGLEPFYRQIPKLSSSVTESLLDLFNKIFEEHIRVRNDVRQRSKSDSDKLVLYQRMGLIERVSTPAFCEGLLNIFYSTWSHTTSEVPKPILKLVKNTLPYCGKAHKGQSKAIKLYNALRDHIANAPNEMYRQHLDLNLTHLKGILDDYVRSIKSDAVEKDEF